MNLYSTHEAAAYLGMSAAAIKYHVYQAKDLTGQRIGHSLVFTQEELDHFLTVRRSQGRPRKQEDVRE